MSAQLSLPSVREDWKRVAALPYEVSNLGRVRRDGRPVPLRAQAIWTGYRRVTLSNGRKPMRRYVHVLVAEAFIGPRPDGHEINHRNGVKHDNRATNLEYVTRSENMRHAHATGLMHPRRGDHHPLRLRPELVSVGSATANAKLDEAQVREIRTRYAAGGVTQAALAAAHGVHQTVIHYIVRGKTWKHVG